MTAATPAVDSPSLQPVSAKLPLRRYLAEVWQRRSFMFALPQEEVRTRHQNTLLGNLWHLGNPLLSVGVYYIIFGILFDANRQVDNFILFLSIGVITFGFSSRCFTSGAKAITGYMGLVRTMRFPRAILPISTVISQLMTYVFELAVLLFVALLTGEGLSWRLLALPLVVLMHAGLNLGAAMFLARLNHDFRDVQQILPFVIRLGIYGSGVMFPIDRMAADAPEPIRVLVGLNPLVPLIHLYRFCFMGWPIGPLTVIKPLAATLLLLVGGFMFLRAGEYRYGKK